MQLLIVLMACGRVVVRWSVVLLLLRRGLAKGMWWSLLAAMVLRRWLLWR